MFWLISAVIIILVVLSSIMFYFLKKIVMELGNQTREYFTLKLQEYDELIEEREKRLLELENNKEEQEVKEEINKSETIVKVADDKVVEYQIEDILQKAKDIDEKFSVDKKAIVEKFLRENVKASSTKLYQELVALKQKIVSYGVYNILTKDIDIEKYFLNNESKDVKKVMTYYLQVSNKINITDFLEYLDLEINKNNPIITIEVGEQGESYNYISPYIQTVYNKKIYKGIKIYYQNQLYDYSLE